MTLYATLTANHAHSAVRKGLTVVAASLLIALSAKISVPFFPVPMTMQTLMILGIGLALGWRLGIAPLRFTWLKARLACRSLPGHRKRALVLPTCSAPPAVICSAS